MPLQSCLTALISNIPAAAAIVSPGSRNAALIRTLTKANIPVYSVIDERSAAFMALGMSQALGEPVILNCTSGTAALNYYPAIAEAYYSRIPLIVITADRPEAAIDNWDGQAIRQKGLFDQHIRKSWHTSESLNDVKAFEEVGAELSEALRSGVPGPVHINVPIAEPFYTEPSPMPFDLPAMKSSSGKHVDAAEIRSGLSLSNKRILFFNGQFASGEYVIGQNSDNELILSDIVSQGKSSIDHWDAMLFAQQEHKEKLDHLRPEVLITAGMGTVSKGLSQFLRYWKIKEHYHLSDHDEIGAPFHTKPVRISSNDLGEASNVSNDYLKLWQAEASKFKNHLNGLDQKVFHELSTAQYVLDKLPEHSIVHLGNSMPVRYASYLNDRSSINFYCNRGTSGIDGCLSTALGYSVVESCYVMLGDVTAQYDINALMSIGQSSGLKVVVLNNRGGQIFKYLNGPSNYPEAFDLQLTEHQRDFRLICEHFGLKYFCAKNFKDLEENWADFENENAPVLLEIKTDPKINYEHYLRFKQYKHE